MTVTNFYYTDEKIQQNRQVVLDGLRTADARKLRCKGVMYCDNSHRRYCAVGYMGFLLGIDVTGMNLSHKLALALNMNERTLNGIVTRNDGGFDDEIERSRQAWTWKKIADWLERQWRKE